MSLPTPDYGGPPITSGGFQLPLADPLLPTHFRRAVFVEEAVATISKLADDILMLWTQDPHDHQRDGTLAAPAVMQGILDNQLSPLYRHLIWDLAARRARLFHPHDPRYHQLRQYPTPPN